MIIIADKQAKSVDSRLLGTVPEFQRVAISARLCNTKCYEVWISKVCQSFGVFSEVANSVSFSSKVCVCVFF